jgi:hypothetical protein
MMEQFKIISFMYILYLIEPNTEMAEEVLCWQALVNRPMNFLGSTKCGEYFEELSVYQLVDEDRAL